MNNPTPHQFWLEFVADAQDLLDKEPLALGFLNQSVFQHADLSDALSALLARLLADDRIQSDELKQLFKTILIEHSFLETTIADLKAVCERDPACESVVHPFLLYKGFHALQTYRMAHVLWQNDRKFLAGILQSAASRVFGVDIHPAAKMGAGIFIDHATGLVIGETAVVGNDVSILQNVTLGGTGKECGDRHPKIEDGVLLAAHAQLLGNIRVGKGAKIGAGAVVLKDVPAHTTYAGVPAKQVNMLPENSIPSLDMLQNFEES
jgi:serine O-acetyltransferase